MSGEVGGQIAVPEEWAKKVAQTVKLLTDPMGEGIDIPSQEQMINVLKEHRVLGMLVIRLPSG